MINEKKLIEKFEDRNLNYYQVYYEPDSFDKRSIFLDTNNIDVFFDYVKTTETEMVFYQFYYYHKENYHIDEELFKDFPEGAYSCFTKEIKKYNSKIKELDFFKPMGVTIFCSSESQNIVLDLNEFWIENKGLMSGFEHVRKIVSNNEEIIEKIKKENELRINQLEKEFRKFMLNDPEFKKQTNSRLRTSYLYSLKKRDEAEKFHDHFFDKRGFPRNKARIILEQAWKEYKRNR